MRSFLAVLALTGMLEQAQGADSSLSWLVHENSDQAFGLSYGRSNSDTILLSIWCEAATGTVKITPGLATSAKAEGERGRVILGVSDRKLELEGEAHSNEGYDFMEITATLPDPKELTIMFKKYGVLKVTVPGNSTTLPLNRQAQTAFDEFSRRCPSLRIFQ
jgi:hypothetical protein